MSNMTTKATAAEGCCITDYEIIDLTQDSSDYMDCDDEVMDITEETLKNARKEQILKGIHFSKIAKKYYNSKDYNMAILTFKKAIKADGTNFEYFYYKSMSEYNVLELHEACQNAKMAVSLAYDDSENSKLKCLMWLLQLKMEMGHVKQSKRIVENIKQYFTSYSMTEVFRTRETNLNLLNVYTKAMKTSLDANEIICTSSKALEIAPKSVKLFLEQARAYLDCEKYWEARSSCVSALKLDNGNVRALHIQCRSYYQTGEITKAKATVKEILNRNPEEEYIELHNKLDCLDRELQQALSCENLNKFSLVNDLTKAKNSYQKCLEVLSSPHMLNKKLNSKICLSMGEIAKLEGKNVDCIDWCTSAINMDDGNIDALVLRGDIEMLENLFEDAQMDYKKALAVVPGNTKILQKLRTALKNISFPCYYQILGIKSNATGEMIKSAYKKNMLRYHPDKNPRVSRTELDVNKKKLDSIKKAYEVLSDNKKRQTYDAYQKFHVDGENLNNLSWKMFSNMQRN